VGDSFTCAIAHAAADNVVVLDCLFERRAPFDPSSVVADVAGLLRAYAIDRVVGDRYAAQWVAEAFRLNGITYEHSEHDRSALYLECLPVLTSGRVLLLDNARMVSQFVNLERRTGAGRDRVDHPPGAHDDLANAVAGAVALCACGRAPMRIDPAALRAIGINVDLPAMRGGSLGYDERWTQSWRHRG